MLNISKPAATLVVVVTMAMGMIGWMDRASALPSLVPGNGGDGSPPEVTPSAEWNRVWVTGKTDEVPAVRTGPVRTPTEDEVRNWQRVAQECADTEEADRRAVAAGHPSRLEGNADYQRSCVAAAGDPGSAARQVVAGMNLTVPSIGMVPYPTTVNPDSVGLVGLQNWLWVDNPEIFQTMTDTATLDGWTISVVGRVVSVDWDMGDGDVIHCTGPGTPYVLERDQFDPSPDCGHMYTKQGYYTVTATAHWQIDWAGGGQSGTVMMDSTSSVPIAIGEWQTLRRS